MRPRRRHAPNAAAGNLGFTIFEMLIVLVILGVAMTVAPTIMAGLDGFRLRAASDEFVERLRETRNLALRRGTATEMVIDLSKLTYEAPPQSGFRPMPAVVDGVDVGPATLLQPGRLARIRFLADGTASASRITLRSHGRSVVIVIDWLTGRVHGSV